ncbi:ABC transporter ATP-binding protein [Naumannella halotolerans]|uniref:Peptide/nickel transport system ATP-binding protein n=1 Tax=Naumannella halotolerans TaxID=993414 RepID=A0A4R7JC00_9ACTN|nr:ABC transporter ATP-binding protein [Naumannella halotolerans]TDT33979.1 peptide/nickel transport system ATP-binding protein [Naumannella halotolerans]
MSEKQNPLAGGGALAVGEPILSVRDLQVRFRTGKRVVQAVDKVNFSVGPGEVIGIVGESGSGKSVTSMAIMGLLPKRTAEVEGVAEYDGQNLLTMKTDRLAKLRGHDLAMVFQDPMSSLNPVMTVGAQVAEVLLAHEKISRADAKAESIDLLRRCGIPDPARRYGEYPHQLSGGMRQRALIATALACKPRLLICDEPTTALDVTIQAQILELLAELVRDSGASMIMITHDLGVVAGLCDHVNVMYAGRIVETANRRDIFAHPRHRYTAGLLQSIPRLDGDRSERLVPIPGTPRDTIGWDVACAFAPRCRSATDACVTSDLQLTSDGDHAWRCVHPVEEGIR